MNFPFLDGDVPRSISCGVYISQNVLLECLVMLMTLILIIKFWQQDLSNKDIDVINFISVFNILSAAF